MVEQGVIMEVGSGGEKMAMASSGFFLYPPPLATYEQVVDSPEMFMETLEKLHAAMGSKFKIPTVGGQELDLHRLFVEVTHRGGLAKVLQDKKWKDVTGAFSFPSSATNASFILRKYYYSLLVHYEQIYFFRAAGWNHETINALQSSSRVSAPSHRSREVPSSTNSQAAESREFGVHTTKSLPEACSALAGSPVHGIIDGKFDSGYLITVKIGSEELRGVLYQSTAEGLSQQQQEQQQHSRNSQQCQNVPVDNNNTNNSNPASTSVVVRRRKRRKKSEIRKRDPAHPKPNRSGYNFFFAEQHARLKQLYPGKDREISRMIGDSWNKLNDAEKSVYQEKAARDKERYKVEMEGYRERLRTGNNSIDHSVSMSVQPQPLPEPSMNVEKKLENEDAEAHHTRDIGTSSSMAAEQVSNEAQAVDGDESSQSIPDVDETSSSIDKNDLDESTSRIILSMQNQQLYTDVNTNTIDLEKEFQASADTPSSPTSSPTRPENNINLTSSSAMIFNDKTTEQQQPHETADNNSEGRRSMLEDDRILLDKEHAFQMMKKNEMERDEEKDIENIDERILFH